MELPDPFCVAVERLVDLLPVSDVNWALTGSVAHRLLGADLDCRDIDVQSDEGGAYEIASRLSLCSGVLEPVSSRTSTQIQSHFGRFRFGDLAVDIEVMGALRRRTGDGLWSAPTNPAEHRIMVPLGPRHVPVLSPDYEAEAYESLGRFDRAAMLRNLASPF